MKTTYDHIQSNRNRTVVILLLFPLALLLLTYACGWIISLILYAEQPGGYSVPADYNTLAMDFTSMAFPVVMVLAGIWICISLFFGDRMVMGFASAAELKKRQDPDLYRLVENTAIAAGLPCPKIYIIEDGSLNAFATGIRPAKASIGLTRGIIDRLERNELEAVIAHELAHIGNRDTRLMVTVVTGVAMFSVIGEVLLRTTLRSTRGRSRGGGKAQLVILTAGVACLVFGILIAPIIRCALSRRREYQADATAAQITRNPDALARALQKISKNPFVSTMDGCSMMGSLCIAEPSHKQSLSATLAGVYATHPPVKNRVMALRQMVGRI